MIHFRLLAAAMVVGQILALRAAAQTTVYTDESAFLSALAANDLVPVHEGFEDDAVWGAVRSTIVGGPHTAPSVTSLGITWTSSSPNNAITTGSGAALSGQWGFYSLPHGDYANGITDGWRGTAAAPLVAVGGWVRTNTPFAGLVVFLDGNARSPIDFNGDNVLGGPSRFIGVIDPAGFTVFDFRETEGKIGDQKYVFGDDFTFAFDGVLLDCNRNGASDALDIAGGGSPDCNNNAVPDECEISETSAAPGGPFFCADGCADDCDDNGVPDACDVVTPAEYASGALSPIGFGSPQSFTIPSAPVTRADAILRFTASANLGGAPDHLDVTINGVPVGAVFGPDGSDCPETGPDTAQLVVPVATFNDAVGGGDATIGLTASAEVDPQECDAPTFVTVEVELFVPSAADADGDGVPDTCAPPACPEDLDRNGAVGFADLNPVLAAWGPCPGCSADLDGNGTVGFVDLNIVLSAWGACP